MSCQSLSFILKTYFLHLKTSYKDENACLWKQLKWNKFPYLWWQTDWENHSRKLKSQTACLRKSLKRNKVHWQGHRLPGEFNFNKWLENKIVLKFAPSPQKRKHLPYKEIVVTSTIKGEFVHIKLVWIG